MNWPGYFSAAFPDLPGRGCDAGCGCGGRSSGGDSKSSPTCGCQGVEHVGAGPRLAWGCLAPSDGSGCAGSCRGGGADKRLTSSGCLAPTSEGSYEAIMDHWPGEDGGWQAAGAERHSLHARCGEPPEGDHLASTLVGPGPSVSAKALTLAAMRWTTVLTVFDPVLGAFRPGGAVTVRAPDLPHRDELGFSQVCPLQKSNCPQAHPVAFTRVWSTPYWSLDRDPVDVANRGVESSRYETPAMPPVEIRHQIPTAALVAPQALSDWLADLQVKVPFCPPVFTDAVSVVTALTKGPVDGESCSRVEVRAGWVDSRPMPQAHGGALDYMFLRRGPFRYSWLHGPVRAMADGEVIWKGYNPSMGNLLIIEYPNGGQPFRSAYHHLVDGRDHDLFLAGVATREWCLRGGPARTVRLCSPVPLNGDPANPDNPAYAHYTAALADGLRVAAGLEPRERWGSNDLVTRVDVGDRVRLGQVVGYIGDTGFNSGGVHLHASLARPASNTEWRFFDPYGLYSQRDCYDGLYPSGGTPAQLQHPSIFCALTPAFAGCSRDVLDLALGNYSRVGWSPRAICRYALGSRWAGVFDANVGAERSIWVDVSLANLAQLAVEEKWFPIHLLPDDRAGDLTFSGVVVKRPNPKARFAVGLAPWEAADLAMNRQVTITDACIYRAAGHWALTISWEEGNFAVSPTHLTWGLDRRAVHDIIRSMRREGFSPVKVQPYQDEGGVRHLVLLRQSPGVERRYFFYQSETLFANSAIALSMEGFRPISVAAIRYAAQPLLAVVYEEAP